MQLGIAENTIFTFTSDNGPEMLPGHNGWSCPWRGSYFTGLEGSLRVLFIIRWPGKVKPGTVSNEIVHEIDIFSTFANLVGGSVPTDRVIESVDQPPSTWVSRSSPIVTPSWSTSATTSSGSVPQLEDDVQ